VGRAHRSPVGLDSRKEHATTPILYAGALTDGCPVGTAHPTAAGANGN